MLYDELSATENLAYFTNLYRRQPSLTPAAALESVGLDATLQRPVSTYSQGMRQRVSLARVLVSQPEILLLDEPFSNIDAASIQQMIALLHDFRNSGRTIVLTTHQHELALPLADTLIQMTAGGIYSIAAANTKDGDSRTTGALPS
jgi:ABC-type multidrug transport system ATPase subunit